MTIKPHQLCLLIRCDYNKAWTGRVVKTGPAKVTIPGACVFDEWPLEADWLPDPYFYFAPDKALMPLNDPDFDTSTWAYEVNMLHEYCRHKKARA